jgi:hypothetical protein
MYNVGFGDSFLLAFPAPDRPRIALIDCGVHSSGPGPRPIAEVAELIFDDIPRVDNIPRIDVVIGTHRHKDHVSGFESHLWGNVQVGQVWMPWVEDTDDEEATRLREGQERTAKHLSSYIEKKLAQTKKSLDDRGRTDPRRLKHLQGRLDMALNSLKNEKAMRTLHQGFLGKPERLFLPYAQRQRNSFEVDELLPGVTVHVMGPSRDIDVIKEMEPPPDQSFLKIAADGDDEGDFYRPFLKDDWALTPDEYAIEASHLTMGYKDYQYVHGIGHDDDLFAAAKLDSAINGTSLMIMFEMGNARLLFPGDAQWGTWRAAMNDPEWLGLLREVTFLKVGHHGSHNATPVEFVQNILPADFNAMISTRETNRYGDIPRKPLLEELRAKSQRVVRSDKQDRPDPAGFVREGNYFVETRIPI